MEGCKKKNYKRYMLVVCGYNIDRKILGGLYRCCNVFIGNKNCFAFFCFRQFIFSMASQRDDSSLQDIGLSAVGNNQEYRTDE